MSFLGLSRSILSLTSSTRGFSTTHVSLAGYKLKSHTGTKKRWSAIANGMFKRAKCGKRHLNTHMSAGKINKLGQTAISTPWQAKHLRKLLPNA